MRRPDPLETCARGLALAAGVDPDSRVPRPGEDPNRKGGPRGQPAWCSFRNVAEAERNAAKAIAVVVPAGQPAQYRDAPLQVFGPHEEVTLKQMRNCMGVGNVVAGVVCADGHLGYAQPVGGVIAYEGQVSISGVGFDIGCGNMAVRLDVPYDAVAPRAADILADVRRAVSFGVGRANAERAEHPLFDDDDAWRASGMEPYRQKAAGQLGTVGGGNHYVDLMRDEHGWVWIGVHFGSRGLGHTTATKYLRLAGGKNGMHVPPAVVVEDSELGRAYLAGMELAGRYAYAGREWVVERVRQIIGGAVTSSVHNHHNYAWREELNRRSVWVVRKGATPGAAGPARLRRRQHGGRRRDHRGRGQPSVRGSAILHHPRRRPAVRPQPGQADLHPRADGRLAARSRGAAGRLRPGRKPDGPPPAARRAGRACGHDPRASHPAAVRSGDGRGGGV